MPSVLVVGDVIVDEYVRGTVDRISPEAPVPVMLRTPGSEMRLGGAANVAENVRSLGLDTTLLGVTGLDSAGDFANSRYRTLSLGGRPTTVKTRFVCDDHQMLRVDVEKCGDIEPSIANGILRKADKISFDIIIVSDYAKGVVTYGLFKQLVCLAAQRKKLLIVDPKRHDFSIYRGADIITPNEREFKNAVDSAGGHPQLFSSLHQTNWIVETLGRRGANIWRSPGVVEHLVPAVPRGVVDVTGAGDTFVAALAVYIVNNPGESIMSAVEFANRAAAVVVGKPGTATVTPEEM